MKIPESHPRKASLELRERLEEGLKSGIVAPAGLIAHGRGEALDYLLGEATHKQAQEAEKATSAALLAAETPVISVNGNTAALCARDIVELAEAVGAKLEVNLFYRSTQREEKIRDVLVEAGASEVYGVGVEDKTVPGLESERAKSDKALLEADVVLVMLEDGDRTHALKELGKKVAAVDLNPLSRTAQEADITIVDNVVRALPNMIGYAKELKALDKIKLHAVASMFDNQRNLQLMEEALRKGAV